METITKAGDTGLAVVFVTNAVATYLSQAEGKEGFTYAPDHLETPKHIEATHIGNPRTRDGTPAENGVVGLYRVTSAPACT